jgi:DNA repair exonuclease SbcCD ATPase subunit
MDDYRATLLRMRYKRQARRVRGMAKKQSRPPSWVEQRKLEAKSAKLDKEQSEIDSMRREAEAEAAAEKQRAIRATQEAQAAAEQRLRRESEQLQEKASQALTAIQSDLAKRMEQGFAETRDAAQRKLAQTEAAIRAENQERLQRMETQLGTRVTELSNEKAVEVTRTLEDRSEGRQRALRTELTNTVAAQTATERKHVDKALESKVDELEQRVFAKTTAHVERKLMEAVAQLKGTLGDELKAAKEQIERLASEAGEAASQRLLEDVRRLRTELSEHAQRLSEQNELLLRQAKEESQVTVEQAMHVADVRFTEHVGRIEKRVFEELERLDGEEATGAPSNELLPRRFTPAPDTGRFS